MTTMLAAISTARSLADVIGEPQLIRTLNALHEATEKIGGEGRGSALSDSYARLGLPVAYVWDDHSSKLRDILMRILVMADNTGDPDLIDACKVVEDRFMLMSERAAYVEVVCRQKPHWT
jgi:hypothetical protein